MEKQTVSLPVVATVWRHWKPVFAKNKWGIILTFFFYSASAYLDLMLKPTQWKVAFDAISVHADPWPAFRLIIMIMAGAWTINRIGDFCIVLAESRVIKQLRDYTLNGLLVKNTQFFNNRDVGGLIAKAKRFANASETVIDQLIFSIIKSALLVVYLVIYSWFILPKISLIFLAWVILFLMITMTLSHLRMKFDLMSSNADSGTTGRLSDILLALFTFRIFARTHHEYNDFLEITDHEKRCRAKAWFIGNAQWATQGFLMAALEGFCMYYVIRQANLELITIGTVAMIQVYIASLAGYMWGFGQSWIRIRTAFADAYEMAAMLDKDDEYDTESLDSECKFNPLIFKRDLHLQDVVYQYQHGGPVLKNISFKFIAGKHYGLIGESGAGKSTLVKLLLRFHEVSSGDIYFSGNLWDFVPEADPGHTWKQSIKQIGKNELRTKIAYVPQDPLFPNRTVREIVSLGKKDTTDAEIIDALKKAKSEFVWEKFDNGLNTKIGQGGVKLSGGERQRLAIAAVILENAPIVIMDEPTSALDADTERVIQESIRDYFHDKTLIVIAHRLATVAILDEVIYMKNGEIAANAPHGELLKISEDYNRMWESQTKPNIQVKI
jgi:ABC-type multidrug transport system fused ATPase/permease subunit